MATFYSSVSDSGVQTKSAGLFDRVVSVMAWIGERRARAACLRELQSMDERDLRDLRISPYDFHEISNGTFRR